MERTIRALCFLAAISVAPLGGAGCKTTTPAPVTRADGAGIEALKAKLARERRFAKLTKVTVNPSNGVVTLSGQVPSESDRDEAGRLASSVKGVAMIYNELQVETATR